MISGEKGNLFFMISSDLLCSISEDGFFIDVNPAWERITGYKCEELRGSEFFLYLNDNDRLKTKERIYGDEFIKAEGYTFRFLCRDNSSVNLIINGSQKKEGETFLSFSSINSKIYDSPLIEPSENIKSGTRHSGNGSLYRSFFENIPLGLSLNEIITHKEDKAIDLRVLEINEKYGEILGIDINKVKGKTIREINPDFPEKIILKCYNVCKTGIPVDIEYFSPLFEKYVLAHVFRPVIGIIAIILEDISSQKKLESELKQIYYTLNQIIDSLPAFISLVNKNYEYTLVNSHCANFFNKPKEEFIGKKVSEIIGSATFDLLFPDIQNVLAGKPFSHERSYSGSGGKEYYQLCNFTPYYYNNSVSGIIAMVLDITDRRMNEERLKKFQAAIDASSDAIVIVDVKTMKYIQNRAHEKLFGFSSLEEFMEAGGGEARIKDKRFIEVIRNRLLNKEAWEGELQMIKKDGTTFYAYETINPILDEAQNLSAAVTVIRDITETKRFELALSESEKRYYLLFMNIPRGFSLQEVILDENNEPVDFRFLDANKYYVNFGGLEPDEIKGKTVLQINPLLDKSLIKSYCNVGLTGKPLDMEYFSATFGKWIHTHVYSPEPGQFATIFEDITEKKEAEIKLSELAKRLAETNATKDKLFSIIAHDLRGPIGNLAQILEIITNGLELDEKTKAELLNDIKKSARNTFYLLENLLFWARSQSGNILIRPTYISLNELISNNVEMMVSHARMKEIHFKANITGQLEVFADEASLNLVVRNLLSNAIKFTGNKGSVSLHAYTRQKFVEVVVEDNGVGMDENTLSNLSGTRPVTSTPGTNNEKGSGLGLTLCRDFIERNGGSLDIESSPGKGSRFKFTLPRG